MRKSCTIHLADSKAAIIAPMHQNSDGVYYEQKNPAVLNEWRDPEALGEAIQQTLERFRIQEANLRDFKKSDWPSYQASGCRSFRDFEKLYLRIWIVSANEHTVLYNAEARPLREEEISVCATLNFGTQGAAEKAGSLVLKLFNACVHLTPFLDDAR